MLLPPPMVLLLIIIGGIPAWLINKFLLKTMRPRESFRRFLLYVLAALAIAFAYTFIWVFVLLKFIAPPNK